MIHFATILETKIHRIAEPIRAKDHLYNLLYDALYRSKRRKNTSYSRGFEVTS
jgi:hypothetical protein